MAAFRPCRPSWNSACSPCFSWPACRLANAVAVFCSGSFNYVMNRNVTFKSSSNYARSIAMFVAMYCWNLLFSNLMMAWIPGLLGWPTMAVKIVTMGMQAVWGFLLCRYVIFK